VSFGVSLSIDISVTSEDLWTLVSPRQMTAPDPRTTEPVGSADRGPSAAVLRYAYEREDGTIVTTEFTLGRLLLPGTSFSLTADGEDWPVYFLTVESTADGSRLAYEWWRPLLVDREGEPAAISAHVLDGLDGNLAWADAFLTHARICAEGGQRPDAHVIAFKR
jgi:hypothetical protein